MRCHSTVALTPSAAVAEADAGKVIATARIAVNKTPRIHIPVPLHAMSECAERIKNR